MNDGASMVGRRRGVTWGRMAGVTWPRMAGAALAVSVGVIGMSPAMASASVVGGPRSVVVRAQPGAEPAVEGVVRSLGGRVDRHIGIINGFSATIDQATQGRLSAAAGVMSVTADGPLQLLGDSYDAGADPYSTYNLESQIGNRSLWKASGTGTGVDVALIDSGVAPVLGLSGPSQVIYGPDLTEESQNPTTSSLDTFGHGTFMAGIIAGRDGNVNPVKSVADQTNYLGAAPNARIVSVKVADARGMTDVSQVIAGIDWVVQHAHDPGMNIRVLNLSFGTDSTQSYQVDPLAYAAEVAWRAGIVVVTSAGNGGAAAGRLTMPAADPYLIAVGAVDLNGGTDITAATVPLFSSLGDGVRNPDLLAPGAHVQGLRDPGSYIDNTFGATGLINSRFFRGSGTSEAAAFVSGSAAQLLQQQPQLTPDQVKALLVTTSTALPGVAVQAQGAGAINMRAASATHVTAPTQSFPPSTGTGSLDLSRGSHKLVLRGVTLSGEQDIFGHSFNSAAIAAAEAAGSTWSGGTWNGSTWSGSTWSGSTWSGSTWSGNDWTGSTWSGSTWSTGVWTGSTWSGSTWSGSTWSGSTWSGSTWSGSTWSGSTWSGSTWSSGIWI
jgi:serine protease AprX